ncbi:MAG: hypothetical protein ACRDN0_07340 [Trebonia sp.]
MSGHTRHPDTEDLADFHAGLASGTRGKRLAVHVAQCSVCASVSDQIGAVSAQLAAAPALAIPRQVEERISAALLAEATARKAAARLADHAAPDREPGRRARSWSRRVPVFPRGLARPAGALVSVAACLLLAVVGYVLSLPAGSPSNQAASAGDRARPGEPLGTGRRVTGPFVVTVSGVDYQAVSLQAQVRQELLSQASSPRVVRAPVEPGSGAQSAAPQWRIPASPGTRAGADKIAPPSSLVGCVMRLTGNHQPTMVESANYESRPAYVIALTDHAWVVPLNCTAAHLSVIKSVALSPAA